MTATDHALQLDLAPGTTTADPNDPSFLQILDDALAGGKATQDFFAGHYSALNDLMQTVATGDETVWVDGTDTHSGMPVQYVAIGSTFLTVNAQVTDTDTLEKGTGDTSTIKQVGVATVTLTTDQGTSQTMVSMIKYGGIGIAGIAATPMLVKLLKPIVKAIGKFLKNFLSKAWERIKGGGSDPDQAESDSQEDLESAASDGTEDSIEVGDGIFASLGIGVADVVGTVVAVLIVAIVIILQIIAKQMTNYVKFFNVTSVDLSYGIGWVKSSAGAQLGPAKVGDTAPIPKVSVPATPPWVIASDTAIYRSDAQFINTNELKGIGYVLMATASGDFPGFRVVVDIPAVGDNSLWVGFGDGDAHTAWNDHNGVHHETTMTATSGKWTLSIATNTLKGTTPDPMSGDKGYFYEHLVVLTDGSVTDGSVTDGSVTGSGDGGDA